MASSSRARRLERRSRGHRRCRREPSRLRCRGGCELGSDSRRCRRWVRNRADARRRVRAVCRGMDRRLSLQTQPSIPRVGHRPSDGIRDCVHRAGGRKPGSDDHGGDHCRYFHHCLGTRWVVGRASQTRFSWLKNPSTSKLWDRTWWTVAGMHSHSSRKVRTPQGRVLDNFQAGRPDGKCSREKTAHAVRRNRTGLIRSGRSARQTDR